MSNFNFSPVHRFTVNWGGTQIGFQEVSGLSHETEVIRYEHGAMIDGTAPITIPGKTKYPESITLKQGYFRGNDEMHQWLKDTRIDGSTRRTLIITLLDEQQQPVMTWTVYNAWPSKIDGVDLNAGSSEIAIQNTTVTFEGFEQVIH